MKNKNSRKPLSRPLNPTRRHTSSRKPSWLWIIAIAVVIAAIAYVVWTQSLSRTAAPVDTVKPAEQQAQISDDTTVSTTSEVESTTESLNTDVPINSERSTSVVSNEASDANTDKIINAPLPATNSLAKEEIDRLRDEEQRLAAQQKLAAEQVEMNKQLTEMKAEQIALLEQQIAQLEASGRTTP